MAKCENLSYHCLKGHFNICEDDLVTEIKLLQNMPGTPSGTSVQTMYEWLDELQDTNNIYIFPNISKPLRLFVTIPVTISSCERCFSKMTIVKRKLRSTMTQTRLDSPMLLFVEQHKTKNVDTDEVIEEFKILNDATC